MPAKEVLSLEEGAVSVWLASETFYGGSGGYFRFIDSDNDGKGWSFRLMCNGKGTLQFFASNGTAGTSLTWAQVSVLSPLIETSILSWSAGEWHHVAVTWGASTIRLFVDGRLTGEALRGDFFPKAQNMPKSLYLLSSKRYTNVVEANGAFRADLLRSYDRELAHRQVIQLFRDGLDPTGVEIVSGNLGLRLLGPGDGFGTDGIVDFAEGAWRTALAPSRRLWQIQFRGPMPLWIDNTAALHAETSATIESGETVLRWKQIPLPSSGSADVAVRFKTVPETDSIQGRIDVKIQSELWTLGEVVFPRWGGLAPWVGAPGQVSLLVPDSSIGRAIPNPYSAPLPVANHYPSKHMSMQWFGLVNRETRQGGLYFATEDPTASLKSFRFSRPAKSGEDPAIDVEVARYDSSMAWPAVIARRDGTWYDVARRYRDFALTAPWAQTAVKPGWLADAGLILPGAYSGIPLQTQSLLGGSGSVLWHYPRWDKANQMPGKQSLVNDTPMLTPLDSLDSDLAAAREKGAAVALYFNPTMWDTILDLAESDPWDTESGEAAAIRDEKGAMVMYGDGSYLPIPPNPGPGVPYIHAARMCPASPLWQSKVEAVLGTLAKNHAVSGFYLDEVTAYRPRRCHAANHGHPGGDGESWVKGYRALLEKARMAVKVSRPEAAFYSESFSEPYLDLIEGYLVWDITVEHAAPLAMAVYHDRAQFLGRTIYSSESLEAQVAKQAQLFAWGGMPGFPWFPLVDSTIRTYLLSLAVLRKKHAEVLVFGDFEGPVDLPGGDLREIVAVDSTGLSGKLVVPPVIATGWRSPSGQRTVVLVSTEVSGPARIVELGWTKVEVPPLGVVVAMSP